MRFNTAADDITAEAVDALTGVIDLTGVGHDKGDPYATLRTSNTAH